MAVIGYALLAAAVFTIDFFLKNYMEKTKMEGETQPVCGGKVLVRKYHNKGAFLDLGESRSKAVTFLSLVLTLAVTVLFLVTFSFRGSRLLKGGLALLLGGAYSNTYDRLRRKYVVDYIGFASKNKRLRAITFNISDFCIMIGALFVVIGSMADQR